MSTRPKVLVGCLLMAWAAISYLPVATTVGKAGKATADTTKPKVTAFDVQPRSIADGGSVSATYTVQDSGGSGLKQIELWRKKDNGSWASVQTKSLSGNGPVSGSISDKPSPSGTYYYGTHVVDNAGNYNTEGSLGAKSVVVSARVPSVRVTSPNTCVVLDPRADGTGTTTIRWTSENVPGDVAIDLSRDAGSSWETLFPSTQNNGQKVWTVRGNATPSSLIRVRTIAGPSASDTSDTVFAVWGPYYKGFYGGYCTQGQRAL